MPGPRVAPVVSIRPAVAGDVAAILELWSTAGAEPSHTDDPDALATLIRHDGQTLLVAVADRRIVGTVIAGWDGWRGSIYRLVVARGHRRQGLGRRLLGEAERHLAAKGARRLQAVVVASDPGATGFWRMSGWEEQEDRLRFVRG